MTNGYIAKMTLQEFQIREKLTQEELAKKLGFKQSTISRYLKGTRNPSHNAKAVIANKTGGLVTPNDFYNIGCANE